jgi:hypothetical protein
MDSTGRQFCATKAKVGLMAIMVLELLHDELGEIQRTKQEKLCTLEGRGYLGPVLGRINPSHSKSYGDRVSGEGKTFGRAIARFKCRC